MSTVREHNGKNIRWQTDPDNRSHYPPMTGAPEFTRGRTATVRTFVRRGRQTRSARRQDPGNLRDHQRSDGKADRRLAKNPERDESTEVGREITALHAQGNAADRPQNGPRCARLTRRKSRSRAGPMSHARREWTHRLPCQSWVSPRRTSSIDICRRRSPQRASRLANGRATLHPADGHLHRVSACDYNRMRRGPTNV